MRKIPSLFMRDYGGTRQVYDEVVHGCEWVQRGEGVATRKWDGTCCMVKDGRLYKRYTVKKREPENFIQMDDDPNTGKRFGWVPVTDDPGDKWHREAWGGFNGADGTYELCGPKIQGGVEKCPPHVLMPHGKYLFAPPPPVDFYGLREWLAGFDIEGIVWHHPDGRMAKIKKKDFGLNREVDK